MQPRSGKKAAAHAGGRPHASSPPGARQPQQPLLMPAQAASQLVTRMPVPVVHPAGGPANAHPAAMMPPYLAQPPPPQQYWPQQEPPMYAVVPSLHDLIINQVHYYFSPENLMRDEYLRSHMDPQEGWLPIQLLANFNRLRSLTTDVGLIAEALHYSPELEAIDGRVRKRHDWQRWLLPATGAPSSSATQQAPPPAQPPSPQQQQQQRQQRRSRQRTAAAAAAAASAAAAGAATAEAAAAAAGAGAAAAAAARGAGRNVVISGGAQRRGEQRREIEGHQRQQQQQQQARAPRAAASR